MTQTIRSPTTEYQLDALVGKTADYNVYIVTTESGEQYLLKIAATTGHNGLLDREAFLLRDLHEEIKRRDAEYPRVEGSEKSLGYQRCFPRLVESFLMPEQGNRRVNVIAIYGAKSLRDLVPIEQWRTRERVRIDPKSSAWIMGRLLKIFTLSHPFGVAMGKIDGGNILVNPIEHHVVLFDWTQARHHDRPLPKKIARQEIAAAAEQVVLALGGDPVTGELPESDQLPDSRYSDDSKRLVDKHYSDPVSAGTEFYLLINNLWEQGFHPFNVYQL